MAQATTKIELLTAACDTLHKDLSGLTAERVRLAALSWVNLSIQTCLACGVNDGLAISQCKYRPEEHRAFCTACEHDDIVAG